MKHLYIRTQYYGSITNEDFRELCIAMPNLEFLALIPMRIPFSNQIIPFPDTDRVPQLTLRVIRSIADTCPHLKHAVLYLNTDLLSLQCYSDDEPFPSDHPLLSLCFPSTPVHDCVDVAAYLCNLFPDPCHTPSITTLCFRPPDDHFRLTPPYPADSDDWMKVAKIMDTLKKQVIPSFKGQLAAKTRNEVRHALAERMSGGDFDY